LDTCGVEAPVLVGTYADGDFTTPHAVINPVVCAGEGGGPVDGPLLTGLIRTTDQTPRNMAADFPGLQSVTLTVLAGEVDVTTSVFGGAVPAGTSLTWSVADTDDSALAAWSCAGQAGADYLLHWTYKPTAAG
jgi:hypothetical protein